MNRILSFFDRTPFRLICAFLLAAFLAGCGDAQHEHPHPHDDAHDHAGGAEQLTPHGGTPVLIAEDEYHLELVHDPSAAKMQAYVLDGHLEDYVEVSEQEFTMVAPVDGADQDLVFLRSGEAGAASSLFEAEAPWLQDVREFDGTIPAITLNGSVFSNIVVRFPEGTQHVHH